VESIVKIAGVLGLDVNDEDAVSPIATRLRRIAEKVPSKFGDPNFEKDVLAAEQAVEDEGGKALIASLFQCQRIGVPEEKVYKIKRVAKGKRVSFLSPSGIRFSFGPVWNDSVLAAKGIAVNENNREKLNMHGQYYGIASPEAMSTRELCAKIAECMAEAGDSEETTEEAVQE